MMQETLTETSPPQYLNLAHQFLDSNFIESTKINKFTILPILSTNPVYESFVRSDPPVAVDYFSHELTNKQYHNCWKSVSNNQFMKPYELSNVDNITRLRTVQPIDDLMTFLPTTSQARLENACWRAWAKKLNHLQELNPTEINWFKENDVTVLYGPLIDDEEDLEEDKYTSACYWSDEDNDEASPLTTPMSSENESDSDSFFQHCSIDSSHTSASTSSIDMKAATPTTTPSPASSSSSLKSILKKRNSVYSGLTCRPKKRISFSQEVHSIRFIV